MIYNSKAEEVMQTSGIVYSRYNPDGENAIKNCATFTIDL